MADENELRCDVLLLVATKTELEQLEAAAAAMGIPFNAKDDGFGDVYYWLGDVGKNRVNAARTRMGAFGYRGSASKGILYKTAMGATSIIQLGMAFGIDRSVQRHGDVLVSQFLFPYDYRTILEAEDRYIVDYSGTQKYRAKQSLLKMFQDTIANDDERGFQVHMGGLLSGGARIFSQRFLRELVLCIEDTGVGAFVGGEMEAVGLLSVSERGNPAWIVVKGISDFADDKRHTEIDEARSLACRNAAMLVLSTLRQSVQLGG